MSTQGRVAGRVALIVGAASGIGRATAVLLAEHGATVWCSDLDAAGAAATARSIAGKSAGLDVTNEANWESVIATRRPFSKRTQAAYTAMISVITVSSTLKSGRRRSLRVFQTNSKPVAWA